MRQVRRRDVIKVMAGAAAAWPIAARAQPPDRARLIGVLLPIGKDDPEYQPWVAAFRAALQELGWVDGRNMQIDIHWATSDAAEIRRQAAELVALAPDVILAPGTSTVGALMQATRTVPIVFQPAPPYFGIRLLRPGSGSGALRRRSHRRSGWNCVRSMLASTVRSSALSPNWQARPMAASL